MLESGHLPRKVGSPFGWEIRVGFLEKVSLKSVPKGWVGFGQMDIVLWVKGLLSGRDTQVMGPIQESGSVGSDCSIDQVPCFGGP